ncbi:MAG TPA: ribosomal protein S18-alanine N-acetyltransferase [Gemmatimonadota bacterium]|nr:ribosomal protein S18-alanine N-acetyltransferase [Gemmatimonadota bacterium]
MTALAGGRLGAGEENWIDVRPLAAADLPSVLSLERSVYPTPWRTEHFARILDGPGGIGWVAAIRRGEIVGYAVGWVAADEAELANIAVVAERRKAGIGGRLLAVFRDAARARGARRLYLEVRASNRSARSFYEAHGFQLVGRRPAYYSRPREDALVMAVDLPGTG